LRHASAPDPAEALVQALHATIAQVVELTRASGTGEASYLNMAVCDGHAAAVSRYTTMAGGRSESLHVSAGKHYVCSGGVCRMVPPDTGAGAVIVSSEQLDEDPSWALVPAGHIVAVSPDRRIRFVPIKV